MKIEQATFYYNIKTSTNRTLLTWADVDWSSTDSHSSDYRCKGPSVRRYYQHGTTNKLVGANGYVKLPVTLIFPNIRQTTNKNILIVNVEYICLDTIVGGSSYYHQPINNGTYTFNTTQNLFSDFYIGTITIPYKIMNYDDCNILCENGSKSYRIQVNDLIIKLHNNKEISINTLNKELNYVGYFEKIDIEKSLLADLKSQKSKLEQQLN